MNHKRMWFAVLGSCLGLTVGLSACGDKQSESPAPVQKADYIGYWNFSDEEMKKNNNEDSAMIEIKGDDLIVLYHVEHLYQEVRDGLKLVSEGDSFFIVDIGKDGKISEKEKRPISLKSNKQEMLVETKDHDKKVTYTLQKMTKENALVRIEALKKMGEEKQKANGDAEKKNEETGAVVPEIKPEVMHETKSESKPEIRKTETGFVFIRDMSVPKLGEAWRDESGMIWGDIARNRDGSILYTVQSSKYENELREKLGKPKLAEGTLGAKEYCESIGAQLPSGKLLTGKSDFERLREYMGADKGTLGWMIPEGYKPQVLPNLEHFFWSSSVSPDDSFYAYYFFFGRNGGIYYFNRSNDSFSVRCVVPRR